MFTEIDFEIENNIEDIYTHSLNKLCSDSMFILQNNSKVLKFLTDETYSKELNMLVSSISMAIKRNRFELVQNILLGIKDQVHKLAALEIKYFDEHETLLRSDIYNTFMPQNLKKHAFITPDLKEIFNILDETVQLSPTNAAFALKSAFEVGEKTFINNILANEEFTNEFVSQIHKRYHANFGMTIDEEFKNNTSGIEKNNDFEDFFAKAI